jgi:Flp pilus assembly protein CpaB
MAVATLTPVRTVFRRPRRADPRAIIGVFLTLAALAGSIAFWVASSDARPVLVATRDLPAGATLRGSDLSVAYVRMDDALYQAALPSDMLQALVGRRLGEPVHAQQVLARAQVGDRLGLAADQVAITIPAKPDSAVDGQLRPGDFVQILLTVTDKTRNEAHARVALDQARILEVGRDQAYTSSSVTAESETAARGAIASVTLAVSAAQAQQLAQDRRTGDFDIVLLPPLPSSSPELAQP